MWYLIESIPDLCTLTYFEHEKFYNLQARPRLNSAVHDGIYPAHNCKNANSSLQFSPGITHIFLLRFQDDVSSILYSKIPVRDGLFYIIYGEMCNARKDVFIRINKQ